jgi:hypothetical protein
MDGILKWLPLIMALGALIGTIVTRLNHTEHNKEMIIDNKKDFDNHVKKNDALFGKIFDELKDVSEDVSYIKGKMNGN